MRLRWLAMAAAAGALLACGEEDPVGLGGLVPEDAVASTEVVLDAAAFLTGDTAVTGFSSRVGAPFRIVAEDFEGVLDAHTLARFGLPPRTVAYTDTAGNAATDTLPQLADGEIVLIVDTLRSTLPGAVDLAVFRTAEAWHASASWTLRVDTGAVETPWSEPGGTRGARVGSAVLAPGQDTLVIPVDSQTIQLWSDTADAARGALIVSETPGSRVRINTVRLRFNVRPSARPDTVVVDSTGTIASTFVYDPQPEPDGRLLVAGTPRWRSFLRLRERLDTLPVPCPRDPTGCTTRLSEVTINYAALLLQPTPPPAGFIPEDTVVFDVRGVFFDPRIPIGRTPIGRAASEFEPVGPEDFVEGGPPVEVPITRLIAGLGAEVDEDAANAPTLPTGLALIAPAERPLFGTAAFGSIETGAAGPRLKLIITATSEVQLR